MFDLVPTGSETSTPLFDLHALVAGVRRRMRPWLLVALIGLLAGAALPIVMPGSATAAARIYVVDSDQTDTGEARMQTAVAIMQSSTVADAALRTLGSTMPTRDFIKTYTATSSGVNLVDLTVRAGNPATAVANATAIADAFVADHIGRAQAAADAYTQALQTRVADLRRQLAQLNRPGAAADPATQAQLQAQIDGLTQQTQQATLGAPEVVAGTRVIDAPHSTTRSLKSAMAINGGLGLLVGLMLGLLAALLLTVVGDRPVLRRDVSANLGASVVAQLGRRRLLLPGRPAGPGATRSGSSSSSPGRCGRNLATSCWSRWASPMSPPSWRPASPPSSRATAATSWSSTTCPGTPSTSRPRTAPRSGSSAAPTTCAAPSTRRPAWSV
ncbi:Wzz/FepE/Etk N-terminal domain-containing protein [Pseudonocardia benzenivorans]